MTSLSSSHPLARLFAGLTEQTFMVELGVADTRLIGYLSSMLARFVHRDAIFAVRGPGNRPLGELAQMLVEAERPGTDRDTRREIFRHMGDFALFWTGVFPEALQNSGPRRSIDAVGYQCQGKRCYYIASTYSDTPKYAAEAPTLRRLSEEFELCAEGLQRVRRHLDERAA